MDEILVILTIQEFIINEKWDDAFEWTKSLVHKGNQKAASIVTKLVRRTKWYDQGLALLKLNTSSEYVEQYDIVTNLQRMERARLSLWSKLPSSANLDEPSDDEPSDDEPSDDEPSDDEPSDDEPSDDEPSEIDKYLDVELQLLTNSDPTKNTLSGKI